MRALRTPSLILSEAGQRSYRSTVSPSHIMPNYPKDRFTHIARVGRGHIPKTMRLEIYERDQHTCQYCLGRFDPSELTIDHIIPASDPRGLDEPTNYVTCCSACNLRKRNLPLPEFARSINIKIETLPVHGDPIIDGDGIPIQFRFIRKRIIDRIRSGEIRVGAKSMQRELERTYRRSVWQSPEGLKLSEEFPRLPGQVRVMIPQIKSIAKDDLEAFRILLELAKSAKTRNLIGTVIVPGTNLRAQLTRILEQTSDQSLKRRLEWTMKRLSQP